MLKAKVCFFLAIFIFASCGSKESKPISDNEYYLKFYSDLEGYMLSKGETEKALIYRDSINFFLKKMKDD